MKNLFLILACILFINTVTNAQYRINRTKYDYRSYKYQVGDPYNPSIAGIGSFLIPGIGQMVSGEFVRGATFLSGYAGCITMSVVGLNKSFAHNGTGGPGGPVLFFLGFFGAIGVDLISVVDAVRVAKVNNLTFRVKNKTSYNFKLQPLIIPINNVNTANIIPVGLTFKVVF